MHDRHFKLWALGCLLAITPCSRAQQASPAIGYDIDGDAITSLAMPGTKAIVLLFVSSDCPISNRYIPEIQRIEDKFAAQHVKFWFVYPNVGETPKSVRQHEAEFGPEKNILFDPDHRLVTLTHATVTPESAILVPGHARTETLHTVYHGRIDDRYLQIGQERPQATQHDLERAIDDVLQDRSVQPPGGPAVGCGIIGRP
jgi:hypothetical protein